MQGSPSARMISGMSPSFTVPDMRPITTCTPILKTETRESSERCLSIADFGFQHVDYRPLTWRERVQHILGTEAIFQSVNELIRVLHTRCKIREITRCSRNGIGWQWTTHGKIYEGNSSLECGAALAEGFFQSTRSLGEINCNSWIRFRESRPLSIDS